MAIEMKFDSGWKQFKNKTDAKKFEAAVSSALSKATTINALFMRRQVRAAISKGGVYEANRPLTVAIKKSTKPLVEAMKGGGNTLFSAINYRMTDKATAFVGVMRQGTTATSQGLLHVNVAEMLHEGYVITVTPKMRGLFSSVYMLQHGLMKEEDASPRALFLARKSKKGSIKPIGINVKAMVVPPRPFIRIPFEDPNNVAKVKANWTKALEYVAGKKT